MGEEFATTQPFQFFCDFGPELARLVTEGRRREFGRFARFSDPEVRASIPDPNALATFEAGVLDWSAIERAPHRATLELHRQLLALRHQWIAPRLAGMGNGDPQLKLLSPRCLSINWTLGDRSLLTLLANLGDDALAVAPPGGRLLFATANLDAKALASGQLPAWSVAWHLHLGDRP
jgi:maltooligosyltrehalose trehalohydrolase